MRQRVWDLAWPVIGENFLETLLGIVDTFLVVVFGGAGSLIGTVISAFGIAQFQSILEFFLSGVLAKVYVLLGVVIILMFRPMGLVAIKVRK